MGHPDTVVLKKLHHLSYCVVLVPGTGDHIQFGFSDSIDLHEAFRFVFNDCKGFLFKMLHNPSGHGFSDTLDDAGSKVFPDARCCGRQGYGKSFHFKLLSIFCVGDPLACESQSFAFSCSGKMSHNGNRLFTFTDFQPGNGVMIVLIFKGDFLESAVNCNH